MPRSVKTATALLVLMVGLASPLAAQVSPEFVVSITPSIVIVTQGGIASVTVNILVNERPKFDFSLSGLPSGVIAQTPSGHAGANTIVLTALPKASIGSFSVELTAQAGNNVQTQTFTLDVKPIPVTEWEYRVERARTAQELGSLAENLGLQSWELTNVVLHEDRNGAEEWVGFFKRQKHKESGDRQ